MNNPTEPQSETPEADDLWHRFRFSENCGLLELKTALQDGEKQRRTLREQSYKDGSRLLEMQRAARQVEDDHNDLRAQVATLTRERDRWQEDSIQQTKTIARLGSAAEDRNQVDAARNADHESQLAALRREAEQLREDKARLDWLEKDGSLPTIWHGNTNLKSWEPPRWDVRSAIDAAMSRARETEGEG